MTLPILGASVTTDIYGTDASDAVSHGLPLVSSSDKMSTAIFQNIAVKAVAERVRRGSPSVSIPSDYFTGKLFASKVQFIKTTVEVPGPAASDAYNTSGTVAVTTFPQLPTPSGAPNYVSGTKITSGIINALISEINAAGIACTCNCNYCTCNCNYCTCNCNYACTCNCNYSDEQLKTEVEYM